MSVEFSKENQINIKIFCQYCRATAHEYFHYHLFVYKTSENSKKFPRAQDDFMLHFCPTKTRYFICSREKQQIMKLTKLKLASVCHGSLMNHK